MRVYEIQMGFQTIFHGQEEYVAGFRRASSGWDRTLLLNLGHYPQNSIDGPIGHRLLSIRIRLLAGGIQIRPLSPLSRMPTLH